MVRQGFKALFCEHFNCPPADYDDRAFKRCLYWHARFFVPVVRLLSSRFFVEDLKLIDALGLATDRREAHSEILSFQDANRANKSLWRTGLKIRVSGRKAGDLVQQLFSEERRKSTLP